MPAAVSNARGMLTAWVAATDKMARNVATSAPFRAHMYSPRTLACLHASIAILYYLVRPYRCYLLRTSTTSVPYHTES